VEVLVLDGPHGLEPVVIDDQQFDHGQRRQLALVRADSPGGRELAQQLHVVHTPTTEPVPRMSTE